MAPQHAGYDLARLRKELRPFRLYWFPHLNSTNDQAARLRRRGELFAPAAVLTGRQSAGRGRGAHSWWSGAGSVTVTFALPIEEHLSPQQVPLVAGLAVRAALEEISGLAGIGLKWPNDLIYEGQKLAGVLCERLERVDLVGAGINLNVDPHRAPLSLRSRITSLRAVTGRDFDPTTAVARTAAHLLRMMGRRSEHPFPALVEEYDRHHVLVGRRVTVSDAGRAPAVSGTCEGLDQTGRLVLREWGMTYRLSAGSVQIAQIL